MSARASKGETAAPAGGNRPEPDFESALARLEEIVRTLESGDLPLEETIRIFEEGQALVRACGALLNRAELRIQELMQGDDGEVRLEPRSLAARADGGVDLGGPAGQGEEAR